LLDGRDPGVGDGHRHWLGRAFGRGMSAPERVTFSSAARIRFGSNSTPVVTKRRASEKHNFTRSGTKRQAQIKLAELITAVDQSKYVEPNKITVAEFVRARVDHWEAAGDISARTAARYRELVENQIVPHVGAKLLQKLRTLDIEEWHTTLRTSGRADGKGGLAPRTIGHAHRVLGKALRDATKTK